MKKPIPLKVLLTPVADAGPWVATVEIDVPGYGTGTACGDFAGQAFQDALLMALANGPEHVEAMVS